MNDRRQPVACVGFEERVRVNDQTHEEQFDVEGQEWIAEFLVHADHPRGHVGRLREMIGGGRDAAGFHVLEQTDHGYHARVQIQFVHFHVDEFTAEFVVGALEEGGPVLMDGGQRDVHRRMLGQGIREASIEIVLLLVDRRRGEIEHGQFVGETTAEQVLRREIAWCRRHALLRRTVRFGKVQDFLAQDVQERSLVLLVVTLEFERKAVLVFRVDEILEHVLVLGWIGIENERLVQLGFGLRANQQ